jgi:3' exoribonuclease, RNase T-like
VKYWIDTEFIEQPYTIDLISVGLVAEDGREFYAESNEVDWSKASQWTLLNVRPQLDGKGMRREEIGYAVRGFTNRDEHPVFWGYFPSYDWVVFSWLFGSMDELPFHYPQLVWTSNSGPSNWATRNCPTRWVPGTTRCLTRDGRGMPGRFSLPSLPLRENGEPRVARTLISSVQLNQPIPRRSGSIRERTHRVGHHPRADRLCNLDFSQGTGRTEQRTR